MFLHLYKLNFSAGKNDPTNTHSPSFCRKSTGLISGIAKVFNRDLSPPTCSTRDFGKPSNRARNSRHILLAAPPTGGAVRLIFTASPWMPRTRFADARGWSCTRNSNRPLLSRYHKLINNQPSSSNQSS